MQFKSDNKRYCILYDYSQEPIPEHKKNVLDSHEEFTKQLAFSALLIHWSASPQPTR